MRTIRPVFIDPCSRGHIHKIERAAHSGDLSSTTWIYVGLAASKIGPAAASPPASSAAQIMHKVGIVDVFIDTLPHGHVKKAASPRGPGHNQRLSCLSGPPSGSTWTLRGRSVQVRAPCALTIMFSRFAGISAKLQTPASMIRHERLLQAELPRP